MVGGVVGHRLVKLFVRYSRLSYGEAICASLFGDHLAFEEIPRLSFCEPLCKSLCVAARAGIHSLVYVMTNFVE